MRFGEVGLVSAVIGIFTIRNVEDTVPALI